MKRSLKYSTIASFAVGLIVLSGCSAPVEPTNPSGHAFGDCELSENPTIHPLETMKEGVLTVAASLPYPAGYRGNTLEDVDGGYMYCLDAEIAHRAGLERIELVNASFEALVTAKSSSFDFAVWDIIVTPERSAAVDFSVPYNTYNTGVLVQSGSNLTEKSIKTATVGVLAGSRQLSFVEKSLTSADVRVFNSNDDLFNALMADQLDVVLNDTATVMPRAASSDGKLEVIAQYPVGGDVAALFPKGSGNVAPVDEILNDMKADGTLDKIMDKWLNNILGGDPDALVEWSA